MKKLWSSLRTRLMLTYAGVMVLGFGILAVAAGRQILQGAQSDYEEKMETQAILVANGLGDSVDRMGEGEVSPRDLAQAVHRYAEQTGARLTIIDLDGKPWLDSTGRMPDDFSPDDPEYKSALEGRVSSDYRTTASGMLMYYSAALLSGDEGPSAVVRLAEPAAGPQGTVTRRWLELGVGVLMIMAAALVASLLLARSLTGPLDALRQSALRVAGGDLDHRASIGGGDEIAQLGQAFNHLAERVQTMIDEQRAFASNASHELRTPLTAIRIRSEALRGGKLDGEIAAQYVAEIDDEAARLGRMVEDLTLLYRFDTGRVVVGRETIEPARFAREMARSVEAQCQARRLTLTVEAPDGLPPVHTSLGHLRVVFRNLLENAIKYTPEGGAITWRMSAENGLLVSTVTDTGQGIAPDDLPHVFERFYRADKAHTRAVSGVGLGLSLIQSVVAFYGGRITLESEGSGKGTTARVLWPLGSEGE